MVKKGGESFSARLYSIAVKDSKGAFTQCRIAAADITESKQAEKTLRQAAKLESLGILAGGIAHDFNNLLTGILGNISLARMEIDSGNDISTILEDTKREVYRARSLTQQLLTFSSGGLPLKKMHPSPNLLQTMPALHSVVRNPVAGLFWPPISGMLRSMRGR